jgi:hypothetical protein
MRPKAEDQGGAHTVISRGPAPRVVAVLADELVAGLGIATTARQVVMSPEQLQHVVEGRAPVGQDGDHAANRIHEALANPCYFVTARRHATVWEVIGFVPTASRYLLVALKSLRAASEGDEDTWWVQTAFPIGSKKLKRMLAKHELTTLGGAGRP